MILATALFTCALTTGLDPSCMRTSLGLSTTTTTVDARTTETAQDVRITAARHERSEFDIDLPFANHRTISGLGSASGAGDVGLSYRFRFQPEVQRWDESAGLDVTLPTGALNFTNSRTMLAPFYAVTYHAMPHVTLVGGARYEFPTGGSRLAFAPFTQNASIFGRLLLTRGGAYAAADISAARVTGDERYGASSVTANVGFVTERFNISAFYAQPLSTFTRDNVYQRAAGLRLSLER